MTLLQWREHNRETLGEALPEAVVILPVGATEQHGRHLATGTDALLAETTVRRAAERAAPRSPRPLIVAPTLAFGTSEHHLPFGATLSLRPETLLAVLLDLARSVSEGGGRRLILLNGHGGNCGICSAAAAAAAVRWPLTVAYADYWSLAVAAPVPDHADAYETSLVGAVEPDWMGRAAERPEVAGIPSVAGFEIYRQASWHDQDGFSDQPARADAELGRAWLDRLVAGLADRLVDFAEST
jgi:creatinine amidohydrolase